jgi:sarcosine oxidase subunit gamma
VPEHDATPVWTQPRHYGADGSGVAFAEATIAAAWNVQGDPAHASFVDAVQRLFGVALPLISNTTATSEGLTALSLGPTSWLLVAGGASSLVDFGAKRDALNEVRGALFDVSASRVAWTISGSHATTVLAKFCPLDFHPRVFAAQTCAQSLFGRVNALFVKHNDARTFTMMVGLSFARDVWDSLCESAAQYGIDVAPPESLR